MKIKITRFFTYLILIGLVCFTTGWLLGRWQGMVHQPLVTGKKPIVYFVDRGTSIRKLSHDLYQAGLIEHPMMFEIFARLENMTRPLQAGEYELDPGITMLELLRKMTSGDILLHKLTIIEGWTFKEMLEKLNQAVYLTGRLKKIPDKQIMTKLGYPHQSPEGRFFPDTYRIPRGTKEIEILNKSYSVMQKRLNQVWATRAADLPYKTAYQALIVASLIEKETHLPQERGLISGVIERRLKKGMPLQIDASVIYGLLQSYTGNLTKADLRKKTPYNTYVNTGLPPTPIALPSEASLKAAVHPTAGKALYFVSKGDGSHVFSNTLKEHEVAVRKYQLKKNGNHTKKESKKSHEK